MIPLLPARESGEACAVLLAGGIVLTRTLIPSVARARAARRAAVVLVLFALAAHLAWALTPPRPIGGLGAELAEVLLCMLPLLVASIPIAAAMRAAASVALPRAHGEADAPAHAMRRRAVLGAATAFVPTLALGTSASGFVQGARPPRLVRVPFVYPDLPAPLSGLRVLQLSDLHLGIDRHVEDLEALLDRVRSDAPDLVVFTGDVADDLRELDPALAAAVSLAPRLGVYASLGNHEYLHGVEAARAVYSRRDDVRLLVSEGASVRVGGATLFIAGADDPVFTTADPTPFLEQSITRALTAAPPGAFRLLLCHRPEGFVPAAARGVELVLAGHTHGGQIGFNGKSAFQPIWRDKYLWGPYARGRSRLYTTSGFGQWFPFRFLCPSEAPLVAIERA